jgi:thiamine transport system substrate-binding protein
MKSKISLVAAALLAALTASAQSAETLTVYAYSSFVGKYGPGNAIKQAFEAECTCVLEWVALDDGVAILNRLRLEGTAARADVALGLDMNLVAEARASGLFAPHAVVAPRLTLPVAWSDDTFLPFDWGHFAFVYDTQKLAAPPRSLRELVDGNPAQKILIQDPRTSTPGLGLLLWVKAVYGAEAPAAWAKLKPRVLTVTKGWSEAYGLFTKGEAPLVFSYTLSPAYHMEVEKTDRYQAASFAEGHYLQVEVAGKLKAAKNPALADRFLAFMLSPAFQDKIPAGNWMYPAADPGKSLPASFDKLVKPAKTLLLPPEQVAANRRAWTDEWLSAMSR